MFYSSSDNGIKIREDELYETKKCREREYGK